MRALKNLPLILILAGIACVSMIVPAVYALVQESFHEARSFFYSGIVGLVLVGLVAIAQATRPHNTSSFRQLQGLLAGFASLPLLLAVPFYESVGNTTFLNAYMEMVSCLTTTGITLFEPGRLSGTEHLWRGQVAWMGGGLMWVAAAAILAPLTLGGFEVTARGEPGQTSEAGVGGAHRQRFDPGERLMRSARVLVPVYVALTLSLWVMLTIAGDAPLVALIHAMSLMSTSGISPLGGVETAASGLPGEMILFCFLFFAVSRLTFSSDTLGTSGGDLWQDPEFRLGVVITLLITGMLFLRHWIGAFDVDSEENAAAALRALWGSVFTVLSFLTTTGFVSAGWADAQGWSGLSAPGMILLGLAVMGGGVATTAGGVKLLRVFALYLNAQREIERLVHPSSVGRTGQLGRRVRREGAFIAWVFFMLFLVALAVLVLGLTIFNVSFEDAIVLSIAVLSNTGPLATAAAVEAVDLPILGAAEKSILCIGMILGRLEVLAIITLLVPDLWRD